MTSAFADLTAGGLGGKADSLGQLITAGFDVPSGFVVTADALCQILEHNDKREKVRTALDRLSMTTLPDVVDELRDALTDLTWPDDLRTELAHRLRMLGPTVAVRSSAVDEDGETSRAGHYLTRLDVTRDRLPDALAEVLANVDDQGCGGAAVVQQMVPADLSVVLFTANPLGILNEAVVTVAVGAGTAVSDETPATTTYVNLTDGQTWTGQPDGAPESVSRNSASALRGTRTAPGGVLVGSDSSTIEASCGLAGHSPGHLLATGGSSETRSDIPGRVLDTVLEIGRRLAVRAGRPLDIELAVAGSDVWVLQVRSITTLRPGPTVTLDSSNVVESYPGLVSPLTGSFVALAYAGVFGSLVRRLTRSRRLTEAYADTVNVMVHGHCGRMYYRIDSWYRVMHLFPGSGWFARVWQDSLGVADRDYERPPVPVRTFDRTRVAALVLRELAAAPRGLAELHAQVREERAAFPNRLAACESPSQLGVVFEHLRTRLFAGWDVTLLNDVLAFVFPALVQMWLRLRLDPDPESRARALVSTGVPVASIEPLRELHRLAADAPAGLAELVADEARAYVAGPGWHAARMRAYLAEYGDRCFEELKLESVTLRQDPALLVRLVASSDPATHADLEAGRPSGTRSHDPVLRALVTKARQAIAGRESSRLDRTRVYGMARDLVVRAGELAADTGRLDDPRDVFWLTLDEAFSDSGDVRDLVAARRHDHEAFTRLPHYRRVVFDREPFRRMRHKGYPDHRYRHRHGCSGFNGVDDRRGHDPAAGCRLPGAAE